jgi:hypothetical protein
MDDKRFDQTIQALSGGADRRTAVRLISGGALAGVVGWLGFSAEGEAKRKRKKKKDKKKRCPSSAPVKCPPTSQDPQGLCAPPGFQCCSEAVGGGACEGAYPQCCAPTDQDPQGLCVTWADVCCSSEDGGGYCSAGETCCPPMPGYPNGYCAWPGYQCLLDIPSGRSGGVSARRTDAAARSDGGR